MLQPKVFLERVGLAHLEIMGQSLSLSYGNPAPFTQGSPVASLNFNKVPHINILKITVFR